MRHSPALIALVAALLLSSSCSDSHTTRPASSPPLEEISEEAKLMALYLSEETYPPPTLSWQIEQDLAHIRSVYGVHHPMLRELRFLPMWEPSCLIVAFTVETARRIQNGEYHAWDDLNEEYRVTEMRHHLGSNTPFVICYFADLLYPSALMEEYADLPGARYALPSLYIGDWSNVYPRFTERGITYLFRHAWGDCPAGCPGGEYSYFRIRRSRPVYIGTWNSHGQEPKPDWWDEARQNERQFRDSWPGSSTVG